MLHAREDYNIIQAPESLIGKDEPVFLLRAKDKTAPETIRQWCILQITNGNINTDIIKVALDWVIKMEEWQKANITEVKLADLLKQ
jgi:hypothetical protein